MAAIDRSEAALETYSSNITNVTTIEAGIKEFSPQTLLEKAGVASGEVDVLIGGPPCKGFSTAGKMDPGNPKNSLIANYISLLSLIDPDVVVMENVTGIMSTRDDEYKYRIVNALREEDTTSPLNRLFST